MSFFIFSKYQRQPTGRKTGKGTNMENQNIDNCEDQRQTTDQDGQHSERLFTQEEVNKIIKKRLYDRKKEESESQGISEKLTEREKAVDDREKSVIRRENKVKCQELVADRAYPKELIEILDTSDVDRFEEQAEKLARIYTAAPIGATATKAYPGAKKNSMADSKPTVKPFGNSRHVPKQY
jgi:hypothetical protein